MCWRGFSSEPAQDATTGLQRARSMIASATRATVATLRVSAEQTLALARSTCGHDRPDASFPCTVRRSSPTPREVCPSPGRSAPGRAPRLSAMRRSSSGDCRDRRLRELRLGRGEKGTAWLRAGSSAVWSAALLWLRCCFTTCATRVSVSTQLTDIICEAVTRASCGVHGVQRQTTPSQGSLSRRCSSCGMYSNSPRNAPSGDSASALPPWILLSGLASTARGKPAARGRAPSPTH